jgi:hypothetical protein
MPIQFIYPLQKIRNCRQDFVPLQKNKINMAKPIRNTPILYGKDAKQFLAEIENLPTPEERKRERARIDAEVNYFLAEIEKMKNKQK